MKNASSINDNSMSVPSESWGDANERGKADAETLIAEARAKQLPILLGHVAREMITRGEYGGYEVGFFHAINQAFI